MRQAGMVLLLAAVLAAAWCGGGAAAGERPLAALAPADVSSYEELNLDRMLGKTPETAALREAFGKLQSIKAIRSLVAQDEEAGAVFDEVMDMLTGFSESVGPRVGWAVWAPNMTEVMGGMVGGVPGAEPDPQAMMPKVLVVAEVRDIARLEELIARIMSETGEALSWVEPYAGAKVMVFADGHVALGIGKDWAALGFPPEVMRAAADRAAGTAKGGSLWEDAMYQRVIGRMPKDAALVGYVSPAAMEQMVAALKLAAPSLEFAAPSKEGIGWAMGVRVEEKDGRRMVTAYTTADLDTVPYLVDAGVALQAAMMAPVFMRSRESAQKAVCLSNVKNISLGMQMYLADNNDRFPKTDQWVEALTEYVMNGEVFKCPLDESGERCSYGMNRALSRKRLADIADPASVVVFYEAANPGDSPVGGVKDVDPARHLGGSNYGYADGHAQWRAAGNVPDFGTK